MPELTKDWLTGHVIFRHAGRAITLHRDMKIDDELIEWAKHICEHDPVRNAQERADRIAEFERRTGTKL